MPPPSQLDGAARALGDVYREAEARINAELRAILDDDRQGNRKRRLRSLLREVESRQAHLLDEARAFLNNSLPFAWQAGASRFAIGEFTWTQGHRQAIGMLALDQFDRVLHATEFMSRDVKELIRSTGVSQARFKVTTGQTAKQAGRELETRLRRQGISAVTYRDGRNIRASTYAEMLMRTSTAVAYNLGGLNQLKGVGVQFVECVDSPDCGLITHGDGFKPNGRVLPIEVAGAYPISHPNCVRDFVSRPDVTSDQVAAEARSLRPQDQLDDQANFVKYLREQAQAQRSAGRQPRTPREPRTPRRERVRA